MWGAKQGAIKNIEHLIDNFAQEDAYGTDYKFFAELIFPILKEDDVMIHDEFFGGQPFPVKRNGYEFVGQVFDEKEETVQEHIINHNNWRLIDKNMSDSFYDRYKDELGKYDAFVVTHTPCFSMLYERFNKPIIVVCSTRYEEPFSSDMIKWKKFNNYLIDGVDKGRIKLVANNKYDKKYTETFLNRQVELIPSLCEYTRAAYTGVNKKFLYSSKYKTRGRIFCY